jgi:hypothetical protein
MVVGGEYINKAGSALIAASHLIAGRLRYNGCRSKRGTDSARRVITSASKSPTCLRLEGR